MATVLQDLADVAGIQNIRIKNCILNSPPPCLLSCSLAPLPHILPSQRGSCHLPGCSWKPLYQQNTSHSLTSSSSLLPLLLLNGKRIVHAKHSSTVVHARQRSSMLVDSHHVRQRSSTFVNVRQRSSTFVNVRQRSSTLVNAGQRSPTPFPTTTLHNNGSGLGRHDINNHTSTISLLLFSSFSFFLVLSFYFFDDSQDDVYRHNWNHTLLQVASKNDEKRDQVRAEIERHKDALKEEFVPKPISTFHSNENEYINPRDKDRLQRKEKVALIAFLDFSRFPRFLTSHLGNQNHTSIRAIRLLKGGNRSRDPQANQTS